MATNGSFGRSSYARTQAWRFRSKGWTAGFIVGLVTAVSVAGCGTASPDRSSSESPDTSQQSALTTVATTPPTTIGAAPTSAASSSSPSDQTPQEEVNANIAAIFNDGSCLSCAQHDASKDILAYDSGLVDEMPSADGSSYHGLLNTVIGTSFHGGFSQEDLRNMATDIYMLSQDGYVSQSLVTRIESGGMGG